MPLYRSATCAPVPLVVAVTMLLVASPTLLPLLDGQTPNSASWIVLAVFTVISLWFFASSYFAISIDDEGLALREGFWVIQIKFSEIKEIISVPTPYIPTYRPLKVEVQRPNGPIMVPAAYSWTSPWTTARRSILILRNGSKDNYLLPHPEAARITELVQGKMLDMK